MSLLPSVFVSYARTDSHSIQYAVGLLEAGGAEVFRDIDDIGFGERWEEVITERISDCERVLVFWSKAAQQSEWVGREYKMALKLGKKLVPVMLDNTPLPSDLGAFHALTLSHFMPKTSRVKRYGGWVLGGLATTALAGVLLSPYVSDLPSESGNADSVAASSDFEAPAEEVAEVAETSPVVDVTDTGATNADTQTFEQSAQILVEAQSVERSTEALSAEQPAVIANNSDAAIGSIASLNSGDVTNSDSRRPPYRPPAAVVKAPRRNTQSEAAVKYQSQSQRESTAAVAVNEAPLIPAPVLVPISATPLPMPIVVETSASIESSPVSDTAQGSGATEVSGTEATAVEGTQVSQLLPWIVGILALLALCWPAVRRYTRRDQAAGERFVEMVFDEPATDS